MQGRTLATVLSSLLVGLVAFTGTLLLKGLAIGAVPSGEDAGWDPIAFWRQGLVGKAVIVLLLTLPIMTMTLVSVYTYRLLLVRNASREKAQ